ncbi:hypothetical protein DFA_09182 [Cavenderia fasciculata]|uniref:Uncharacterized protein n=1 Tax=Cavenderia fasciculata TaxID=261658 RepID=F4Q6X4_CACFS|nr:uncharacterized protein DFA_09182 [Cavenderia fasciculata]EGG16156.1 hypothetical protein DFA_09182 [Cavenderia fasciculata]|eukprot:XP_004352609.1 hypothetical protein DFA_09182 [Cavenderia fasciculata]
MKTSSSSSSSSSYLYILLILCIIIYSVECDGVKSRKRSMASKGGEGNDGSTRIKVSRAKPDKLVRPAATTTIFSKRPKSNPNSPFDDIPVIITIGYRSYHNIELPPAFAITFASVTPSTTTSATLISSSATTLNEKGEWHGVVRIDWTMMNNVVRARFDINLEVCMVGKYVLMANQKLPYLRPTSPQAMQLDERIIRYPITYTSSRIKKGSISKKPLTHHHIFSGEGLPAAPNNFIFAYSFITNLALQTIKHLGLTNLEQIYVLIDYSYRANYSPISYNAKVFDGNSLLKINFPNLLLALPIAHEYGHYVQSRLYHASSLTWVPTEAPGGYHALCQRHPSGVTPVPTTPPQSAGVAWTEGYPTAYAVIMLEHLGWQRSKGNDYINWASGYTNSTRDLEYYWCNLFDLETDEGRIAAMMYDLYDAQDDSLESPAIAEIIEDRLTRNNSTLMVPEWFGSPEHADDNSACPLTPKEILVDAIALSLDTTLYGYITAMRLHGQGCQRERAINVINYHYGSNLLIDRPDPMEE